jgi:predicted transcriptional regulator
MLMDYLNLNNPEIQSVLRIAEEMAESNKNIDAEQLILLSRKRLKIPRQTLLSILQYLTGNHILVEGTKFTRDTVILNEYRKQILDFIVKKQGAHFSAIKKEIFQDSRTKLGSSGQLIWHLGLLLRFKYIKRVKIKNNTLFLPIDMDEDEGLIYYLIKDPIVKDLLCLFSNRDFIPKTEIYKALAQKREDLYYRINKLFENEIFITSNMNDQEIGLRPEIKEKVRKLLPPVVMEVQQ